MRIISIVLILLVEMSLTFGQKGIDKIISDSSFVEIIGSYNNELKIIQNEYFKSDKEKAIKKVASYFAKKMGKRYFFDWKQLKHRLDEFHELSSHNFEKNYRRANYQMSLFDSNPMWKLPSLGKDGSEITPYKLRHLARQHEALDIALVYYLEKEDSKYKDYLVAQVNSLADNFVADTYDKKGNAIFESFRAGYRVFNWLYVYNYFLASQKFSWREQIDFLKTFYFHAEELNKDASKFRFGNHQTKGLVALSMISIIFPEFDYNQSWFNRSLKRLTEHLQKEILSDGFQFERSVHYHIGDIDNYFYVAYLAKINDRTLNDEFTERFKSMFEALVKIALPNKTLPVLQDDTDEPWAEFNSMGHAMTIGAILFDNSTYKYFSDKNISSKLFWLLRDEDIIKFKAMKSKKPVYGSLALPDIGYYVMRNGWNDENQFMILSAGLSSEKPDHQHGDMLGIYAYADENIILPNYQFRYFLKDYRYFKNSFTKNVALVDSIPQGSNWKGNSGGSGFGKWLDLPNPKTIAWISNEKYDVYIGSHDKYEGSGVRYFRKIIFLKDGFWLINDEFYSSSKHDYQQVWQGHYSKTNNSRNLISAFPNGGGLTIYQLKNDDYKISFGSKRGKGNAVVNKNGAYNYSFLTLLYPFEGFEQRLLLDENGKLNEASGWNFYQSKYSDELISIASEKIICKNNIYIMFGANSIVINNSEIRFSKSADVIVETDKNKVELLSINSEDLNIVLPKELVANVKSKDKGNQILTIQPSKKIIIWER